MQDRIYTLRIEVFDHDDSAFVEGEPDFLGQVQSPLRRKIFQDITQRARILPDILA
jgi:hypothetical protein